MLAAKYVATQLQEMGLKPAGDNNTYFQKIRFREITLDRDKTTFTLKINGQEQALKFGDDFIAGGDDLSPDSSVEAQTVFVGYGITAPEFKYDDYANTDVTRKNRSSVLRSADKLSCSSARSLFVANGEGRECRFPGRDWLYFHLGRQACRKNSAAATRALCSRSPALAG